MILFKLFISFALIGLGAYGGGLVTIPLIQHEIVNNRNWLTFGEIAQLIAIAQMTPGPIAINAATFIGFQIAGIAGSVVATVAVILPSISILILVAPVIDKFSSNKTVEKFRYGLQIGILSLILFATWSYGNGAIKSLPELALGAAAFLFLIIFEGRLNPVIVILAGGVAGVVVF